MWAMIVSGVGRRAANFRSNDGLAHNVRLLEFIRYYKQICLIIDTCGELIMQVYRE